MDAVLLPALIFVAEMCVITLSTLRIIFVAQGRRYLAPCLGFFEVVIWLFAISQVMKQLDNGWCFLAFAAGFTVGNYLGILIEKTLAMGMAQVSIVAPCDLDDLAAQLRAQNYGATSITGEGSQGPVQIIFTIVRRRQLKHVLALIETTQPGAFYAVDEVSTVSEGIFPTRQRGPKLVPSVLHSLLRRNVQEETSPGMRYAESQG